MKGKKLEILVLVVSFVILAVAMILMIKSGTDNNVKAISLVNRLFSLGFLVYIAYSYLLSNNLNKEITDLEKNVANLKEEVARKRDKIKKRDEEIEVKTGEIKTLNQEKVSLEGDLAASNKQLTKAKSDVKKLKAEIESLTAKEGEEAKEE